MKKPYPKKLGKTLLTCDEEKNSIFKLTNNYFNYVS